MLKLILITNFPEVARDAQNAGVERIMVDLEDIGKKERQSQFNTVINQHSIADVGPVRAALDRSELIVRVNPLHAGSHEELEAVLKHKPDSVMLPMFREVEEAEEFCRMVASRARVILLAETAQALVRLVYLTRIPGVSEIYGGLNDLRISLGLDFLHEVTAGEVIENMARITRAAGLPFGFGGIARIGQGDLPAELVLSEHYRVGSSSIILGRVFHGDSRTVEEFRKNIDWATEIGKLREVEARLAGRGPAEIQRDHEKLQEIVRSIVARKRAAALS